MKFIMRSINICCLILSISLTISAQTAKHPILYFFWGNGCPHCEKEKEFLPKLQARYPQLEMRWFEAWDHPENRAIAEALRQAYNLKSSGVPVTFLGRWHITGYLSDETTGKEIQQQVIACLQQGCIDALESIGPREILLEIRNQAVQQAPVGWELFPATAPAAPIATALPAAQNSPDQSVSTPQFTQAAHSTPLPQSQSTPAVQSPSNPQPRPTPRDPNLIRLPMFGKTISINVAQTGLPAFTFAIGLLDGFNPCAMWVLSFLLTIVIYAKSRAKILLIGGIFVFTSGFVYFLFMVAWLNLYTFKPISDVLRILVAIAAIVMGLINCKDFFFFKKGISLTIPESAQPKLFKQMRTLAHTTAIPALILGTITLAFTANLIELACTAGFPAIYTNVLTRQPDFSTAQYYLYLVLYNVVYVIPLAVIVGVFAWKMGGQKLTEKQGRILKLAGGALMLALGVIMLFKPTWLMFG